MGGGSAWAQPNLALNKPTLGSLPCNANEGPAKAVNGSVSGGLTDKWCTHEPTKFLQVNLNGTFTVRRFIVRHASAGGEGADLNTRDFNIQVSTNGTTFTTVATVSGNTAGITTHDIPPTAAAHIRLNVTAPEQGTGTGARIYEFEAYEAPPARPNRALNRPASGSPPCRAGEEPAKAVNGSVSGGNSDKFCSKIAPRFLEVNLGSNFAVDQIVIRHAGAGGESTAFNTRDFTLQVGGTTVATVAGNTASVTTHNISPPRQGSTVRLNVSVPTQNTNTSMRIYELEVFGEPAAGGGCTGVINSWQEHWFEHNLLVTRVACDDHAAIFFDDDVDRAQSPWILSLLSRQWVYFKNTYGSFGPDPRIYSIHHQGRFGGGHPGDRFSTVHDFRNSSDIGVGSWAESGGNHDIASHEVCHVVESANNNVHGSPAFPIWGDSKWAEFCQFDLYTRIGMQADADRVFTKFTNTFDGFPRANTFWFRDWFFPLWRDRGGAQVMVRFFGLLAQHFPKNTQDHGNGPHLHYTRNLNLGEFVHFMSGAANANLFNQARTAFGTNTNNWETQFNQARIDFPQITYP
ncbi:MAG TPA: discoidin domain-containing protein [Vicinamibacteria bacterium]